VVALLMEQKAYRFLGSLVIIHVSGEETQGRFPLLEFLVPPGDMPPLHVHRRADQTWYTLEGELSVYLPGESITAGPRACVRGPMNVPHTHKVTSADPVRFVEVNSPAGYERFVAAVGEPTTEITLPQPPEKPPDLSRLSTLAAEHGIQLLGPPGTLP
jgi:mannose-6-phosphate isomerase-like protein (cupin superfamily)